MKRADKPERGTVCWVDLMTPDLEKATAFYGALLGWSFTGGDDPATGSYTMANVSGLRVAGIGTKPEGMSLPSTWTVYFATDNADDTARTVERAGGEVVMGPMDVMESGRMAIATDPTGAAFGLWQPKSHTGVQLVDEPGAMTWHEVYTRDAGKARSFYTRVLGVEEKRLNVPNMEYWTLHRGPRTVCGLMQMGPQYPSDTPSHWHTYFAVRDVDAAASQAIALGGKVDAPAFDSPYGRLAVLADPFGALFCVIKTAT